MTIRAICLWPMPTGVIAAFNLIAGPKELLTLQSDHHEVARNHQPRSVWREEWLSALVKGEPAPVKNSP